MTECTCCDMPVYTSAPQALCDDCTESGPGDAVDGCGPDAWHCVCDRSCDGSVCGVKE